MNEQNKKIEIEINVTMSCTIKTRSITKKEEYIKLIHLLKNALNNNDMSCVKSTIDSLKHNKFKLFDDDKYKNVGEINVFEKLFGYYFYTNYKHNNMHQKNNYKIIEMISNNFSHMITYNYLVMATEFCATSKSNMLFDILYTNYEKHMHVKNNLNNIKNDVCVECDKKYQLYDTSCKCLKKIHLHCLVNKFYKEKNKCTKCDNSLCAFIFKDKICFPTSHIYVNPTINRYEHITNIFVELNYALNFLQCNIVEKILNNMTNNDFEKYINDFANYYVTHNHITFEMNKYLLCTTNEYDDNIDKINTINKLLSNKLDLFVDKHLNILEKTKRFNFITNRLS